MDLTLFVIGLVAVLVGAVMIGFGIPINAFEIGNTLILAGTTAAVGGLIMVGLAMVVRQLHGLVDALEVHPPSHSLGNGVSEPDEVASARDRTLRTSAGGQGIPEHGASEAAADGERPFVPAAEEAAPASERRAGRARDSALRDQVQADLGETAGPPQREQPRALSPFAPVRTDGSRRLPQRRIGSTLPHETARSESPGSNRQAPPLGNRTRSDPDGRQPSDRVARVGTGVGSERASILKSGVIEGMAYTLYVDGSIEAELPQGTLKFATIEELREYLANKK
jgi:hypothetical protein